MAATLGILALSACMSIGAHLPRGKDPDNNNPWPSPYQATVAEAYGVVTPKPAHGPGGGPFRLLFLLDLPLTAAVDTLFCPIDATVLLWKRTRPSSEPP